MVIFSNRGRFGNQLFQYAALRELFPGQPLHLVGFQSLAEFCDGLDARVYDPRSTALRRVSWKAISGLMSALVRLRIVSGYRESLDAEGPDLVGNRGLLSFMKFADESYFQCNDYTRGVTVNGLRLKPAILEVAQACLDGRSGPERRRFFVHVRRSDYLHFPSPEAPAVLPFAWYVRAMDRLRELHPGARFIVTTDDLPYARERFGAMPDTWVSGEAETTDFGMMCLCDGGVLSASSFAWWGAFFARQRGAAGPFLAPLHWCGHRRGRWYPGRIQTPWLDYLEVG